MAKCQHVPESGLTATNLGGALFVLVSIFECLKSDDKRIYSELFDCTATFKFKSLQH